MSSRPASERAVRVVQDKENPVAFEVLAASIQTIADGMKKLTESRLTEYALILLLVDATKLSRRDVGVVLNALKLLEYNYLKPKPAEKRK